MKGRCGCECCCDRVRGARGARGAGACKLTEPFVLEDFCTGHVVSLAPVVGEGVGACVRGWVGVSVEVAVLLTELFVPRRRLRFS